MVVEALLDGFVPTILYVYVCVLYVNWPYHVGNTTAGCARSVAGFGGRTTNLGLPGIVPASSCARTKPVSDNAATGMTSTFFKKLVFNVYPPECGASPPWRRPNDSST